MKFNHTPVMLSECIEALRIKPDGIYVDGTLGGAGHSVEIVKRLGGGRLVCIDRDMAAINAAKRRLDEYRDKLDIVKDNFNNIDGILDGLGIDKIDGALLDLGVSSHQLDEADRGFSYIADAPLDMRMDREALISAADIINTYSCEGLSKIIYAYGEERWAKRIAEFIVKRRTDGDIRTTGQLVEIIEAAIPAAARKDGGHPAKRTFQAIRIEVNGELSSLGQTVKTFMHRMNPSGRMAVITFHSLEDRLIKETYQELARGCVCPKEFPVCVCNERPEIKIITKKPVIASERELSENRRSKSAKLRVAEKL